MSLSLVVCEPFNPLQHGFGASSSPGALGGFLVNYSLTYEEVLDGEHEEILDAYENTAERAGSHPTIRAYGDIMSSGVFPQLHIAKTEYLQPGEECIGVLKTHWLRLIQRRWKTIMFEREQMTRARAMPSSLSVREATGQWPAGIRQLPGIRGMLSGLAN
jgi:hypothetical protein